MLPSVRATEVRNTGSSTGTARSPSDISQFQFHLVLLGFHHRSSRTTDMWRQNEQVRRNQNSTGCRTGKDPSANNQPTWKQPSFGPKQKKQLLKVHITLHFHNLQCTSDEIANIALYLLYWIFSSKKIHVRNIWDFQYLLLLHLLYYCIAYPLSCYQGSFNVTGNAATDINGRQ